MLQWSAAALPPRVTDEKTEARGEVSTCPGGTVQAGSIGVPRPSAPDHSLHSAFESLAELNLKHSSGQATCWPPWPGKFWMSADSGPIDTALDPPTINSGWTANHLVGVADPSPTGDMCV